LQLGCSYFTDSCPLDGGGARFLRNVGSYKSDTRNIPEDAILERKLVLVTGRGGLEDTETSWLPYSLDKELTDGSDVVSLTRRQLFTSQEKFLIFISVTA
jgi:hypothetical protein